MVNYEERIAGLIAAGRLTPEQGAAMATSVQSMPLTTAPAVKKLPLTQIAIVLGVGLLCVLLFSGSGTPAPEVIQNVDTILNQPNEVGAMSQQATKLTSVLIIGLPLILSLLGFVYLYNSLVTKEEEVMGAWAQVETTYQRRADLIPGLIKTVDTFMEQEVKVMATVAENRPDNLDDVKAAVEDLEAAQEAAKAKAGPANLDDEQYLQQVSATQKALGSNINRLMGLVENYPQLRSADNFLALQDQLEGTENRINVSRMVFNDAVRDYNSAIRRMPGSLVAGFGDFKRKAYYESSEGADQAVKVDFGKDAAQDVPKDAAKDDTDE